MPVSAEVATLFLEELARRNIPVRVGPGGGYEIELPGGTSTVTLENLSRDFERDRDPDRVVTFVDSILTRLGQPSWDEAGRASAGRSN